MERGRCRCRPRWLLAENRLETANLDAPTSKLLDAAKNAMRDHFHRRASEKAAGLVEEWQRDNVYPYQGQPVTQIEEAERQVFNVVVLNVNHFLPEFQGADEKTKRLQLRLLGSAVESAPADLSKILTEVLDLPVEKRQELADLLDRTTLSHIISASKIIADRLEFLQGLETLVFDQQDSNGNLAVKLLRTFAAQTEALQRYRGKGQQKVTVEHVHVHTGGQAIVGSVSQSGGGRDSDENRGQPHAPENAGAITFAPDTTLPSANEARDLMPVASGRR